MPNKSYSFGNSTEPIPAPRKKRQNNPPTVPLEVPGTYTSLEKDTIEDDEEERNPYEQVEPVWKSYLYQVQLKAPKPHRVVCNQNVGRRPGFYGKEFHGAITREVAEQLVMQYEGCYLTRESQRQPGTYALTFRFNNAPKNYRLYFDEVEKMHYVGEKRFETVHDLVADGLITLYVDFNAKDYIDHMTLNAKRSQSQKDETVADEEDNKGSLNIQVDPSNQTNRKLIQNSFKASDCAKPHNFKTHSYYGPHWCELCRNFMWGLKNQGVRCQDCSYDCHKQCSDSVHEDCSPDKKLVKRVFGVDLTTLIKAHDQRRPAVVDTCIKEIELRALEAEGIYRISGYADDITHLQTLIDRDGIVPDISEAAIDDINVICGLLKLYFRQLPIPIITFDLYDQFIQTAKLEDRYEVIKKMCELIDMLPPAHYETLKYFCRHLQRVMKYRDKNLMSSENLGIVFGPTLMRAPDSQAMQAMGNLQYQKKIVMFLIEEQDVLFER